MSTPRMRLRFERTGRIRDVVEFRRDGWPICPSCNEDELGAIRTIQPRRPQDVDLCYRCGPVDVVDHVEPEAEKLPGVT